MCGGVFCGLFFKRTQTQVLVCHPLQLVILFPIYKGGGSNHTSNIVAFSILDFQLSIKSSHKIRITQLFAYWYFNCVKVQQVVLITKTSGDILHVKHFIFLFHKERQI